MSGVIDLRSDTVTLPPPEMRRAMAEAELGDDVYGEDPTVNRLEAMMAERLGKEAGLFTASGTMSNLVALLTHCQRRGTEVILGEEAHILQYEVGGAAGLGGLQLRPVPNTPRGMLDLEALERTVRGRNIHWPETGLICVENTHNRCGGAALTPADMAAGRAVAARHGGIPIHLDGARIFNAAVALGVPAADLARDADSVAVSLSKGLACPVGSVLCGSGEFIARARKYRKMVGGGMRQAGVLAAAGVYALEHMVDRLAEDHENARRLAAGLAEIPGLNVDAAAVQTNIVLIRVDGGSAAAFLARLRAVDVLATESGPETARMVTHYGIERAHVDEALVRIRRAMTVEVA
ncbi:MAG TPA: low-specificity L-threonine aldolase [Dehalococcoidia bacterium]